MRTDIDRALFELFQEVEEHQTPVDLTGLVEVRREGRGHRWRFHPALIVAATASAVLALGLLPLLIRTLGNEAEEGGVLHVQWAAVAEEFASGSEALTSVGGVWSTDEGFARLRTSPENFLTSAEFTLTVLVSVDGIDWATGDEYVVQGGRDLSNWTVSERAVTGSGPHGFVVIDRVSGSVVYSSLSGEPLDTTGQSQADILHTDEGFFALVRRENSLNVYSSVAGIQWTLIGQGPREAAGTYAVVPDGVYSLGGNGTASDLWFFDLDTAFWSEVRTGSNEQVLGVAVWDDQVVYLDVFGLHRLDGDRAFLISDDSRLRTVADAMRAFAIPDVGFAAGRGGIIAIDPRDDAVIISRDGRNWSIGPLPEGLSAVYPGIPVQDRTRTNPGSLMLQVGEDRIVALTQSDSDLADGVLVRTVWVGILSREAD